MSQQPFNEASGSLPPEAGQARTASLVLGIIGIFFLGIILGPLAIMQANKAERLGERSSAGRVLGWIATALGVAALIFGVLRIVLQ
ncbi:hypothetical protein [Arthrobacter sp. B0490]|uniref:hypothetical protein n=1 Tax=Arthrobacter sp. B0490 TaxID=2058891 RepID=UPI000CE35EC0|nr:hypothetical protein [Arthrobacter sp. B0490]